MKRLWISVVTILFAMVMWGGGFHMKFQEHRDGYYHHGTMDPAVDREYDLWFSDGKIALSSENFRILLDGKGHTIRFLNLEGSSYVESTLPLNLAGMAEESLAQRLAMFPVHGVVKPTEEKKIIQGVSCRGFDQESWIEYQGERYYETETRTWVADQPFQDWDRYLPLVIDLLKLENPDEEFLKAQIAMGGLAVATESVRYADAKAIRSSTTLLLAEEAEIPAELFAIPEGFEKKATLTRQDLP
ncbi:MAG TPA: hypothetical protein PK014_00355 [Thermoanaerobaculia bacterium]|nr:hypothetical protein [Thermoanaerobaculia bacterium]HXK66923.1 hypothetical protein [Thermoanaerobaculia bacterium]